MWLSRLFLGVDVRQFGDGNPGAANVFKAGGKALGVIVLLLDVSKAAIPVGLSYNNLEIRGYPMALIAIAPMLGHIFSPFLRFRGGKAIATLLGVWIGLTLWKAPLGGLIGTLLGVSLLTVSAWAVMLGMVGILVSLLIWFPDPMFYLVCACQTLIMIWTLRQDLRRGVHLRPWITSLFSPPRK